MDSAQDINFVSCVKWVSKGVSKREPIKVELSKAELQKVIKKAKNVIKQEKDDNNEESIDVEEEDLPEESTEESESEDEDDVEMKEEANAETNGKNDADANGEMKNDPDEAKEISDEYNFENYDNEADEIGIKLNDLAVYEENDPYTANLDDDADEANDSEAEDDLIKRNDNLLIAGHVEGDASVLEVFIHNEDEDSFYVHHDILLSSIPLALEWLNYDPADVNRRANLMAVGDMSPIIEVWDLDLMNCIIPTFKLGRKGNKKKGKPQLGHKDAVLALSWNSSLSHVLASGSADQTVLLWDLEIKQPNTTLTSFKDKIQTLKWHPTEMSHLLTGSSDKKCRLFDCQNPESFKKWKLKGEVERAIWNHFNPFQFFSSDDKGFIYCIDTRQEDKLWEVNAHSEEVTGLMLSSQCPGFLATASQNGEFKIWDVNGPEPVFIAQEELKIGGIQCLDCAPDEAFLFAAGGDRKRKNLLVFNPLHQTAVKNHFENRKLHPPIPFEGMSVTPDEPTAQPSSSSFGGEKRPKHHKKKNKNK